MPEIVNDFNKTWDGIGLPTRENCDFSMARQRFLWMFTGFAVKGAPLPLPTEFFESQSEHLCECLGLDMEVIDGVKRLMVTIDGVRVPGDPLPDSPTRKYQAGGNMLNRLTAAGQWVDSTDPDVAVPDTRQIYEGLPQHERAEIANVVLEQFGLENEPPAKIRVLDLAKRLGVRSRDVAEVATAFGQRGLRAQSNIDRQLADRIALRIKG
ncbi:phage gene 29 protein family protein [Rhodococcus sp. Leaf233]|uniref:phage gene 29 protein family protein n=1 Tax=Rhodococcus sp. Leaf233 TaxID=1736302 RepID=UPI00070D86C0|nr:translation initiation factor IF-2 N-terminal domain-containing protein [Rhodococcus sp. Leaf233]KQU33572.1 hypothetical protein ASH04_06995 [Rhodococcus sp. Leaf233]